MTRFRAFVAANVLLVIVALLLVSTEWRKDDRNVDLPSLVGTLSQADIQTAIERMRTTTRAYPVLTIRTRPAVSPAPVKPVKRPKPPIAGPDLMTGKLVALSQFRGKPVFVSVWASWNAGSIEQAPTIGRWARSHENQVDYLGIDLEEPRRTGRAFARRYGMTFPSISDPVGKLGVWAYAPTTLVFDRRHVLVQQIRGSASVAELDAALRRVTRSG